MPVHIGKLIQAEVEYRQLTHKEFGALIHRNEKTVPDIYDRATMQIDFLIAISVALRKDFIKFFYDQEPMNSIRDDESSRLKTVVQQLAEENKHLQNELFLTQKLADAWKETVSIAKDQLEHYKSTLSEL